MSETKAGAAGTESQKPGMGFEDHPSWQVTYETHLLPWTARKGRTGYETAMTRWGLKWAIRAHERREKKAQRMSEKYANRPGGGKR